MDRQRTIQERLAAVSEAAREARLRAEEAHAVLQDCISTTAEARLALEAERQRVADLRAEVQRLLAEAQHQHDLGW